MKFSERQCANSTIYITFKLSGECVTEHSKWHLYDLCAMSNHIWLRHFHWPIIYDKLCIAYQLYAYLHLQFNRIATGQNEFTLGQLD